MRILQHLPEKGIYARFARRIAVAFYGVVDSFVDGDLAVRPALAHNAFEAQLGHELVEIIL